MLTASKKTGKQLFQVINKLKRNVDAVFISGDLNCPSSPRLIDLKILSNSNLENLFIDMPERVDLQEKVFFELLQMASLI